MAQLPDLRYIGIMATGVDQVDHAAAKEMGITVTYVPSYANHSVAQLTFALLLELYYNINAHHRSIVNDKVWSSQAFNSYWLKPLEGLYGKTIGIIGMGKIGEQVSKIARAFDMEVLAYDVIKRNLADVEWVELEDLLSRSDVVTTHCPLLDSTRGFINKTSLSMMKKTAYFINTSRGPLVVEEDLADALNEGVIAGAGLDVLGVEPPAPDNPLFSAKNIVITPHIGWATIQSRSALISEVASNYAAFLIGNERNHVVKIGR